MNEKRQLKQSSLDSDVAQLTATHSATTGPLESSLDLTTAPLSYAQEGVWFTSQLAPGDVSYNVNLAWRVVGPLDVAALQSAIMHVASTHAALRTKILIVGDTPRQTVSESSIIPVAVIKPTIEDPIKSEDETEKLLDSLNSKAFDLGTGPLVRATVIELGKNESIFLLNLHHIITDAQSNKILIQDLLKAYRTFLNGTQPILPKSGHSHLEYAAQQRHNIDRGLLRDPIEYWNLQLAEVRDLDLPIDFSPSAHSDSLGRAIARKTSRETLNRLRQFAARERATIFMLYLTAFQLVLAAWSGNDDLTVGTVMDNRGSGEFENTVGLLTNMVVLRTRIDHGHSFRSLLGAVRDLTLSAYEAREAPFEFLVKMLRPSRSTDRTPLFRIMATYQSNSEAALNVGSTEFIPMELVERTSKFDLSLIVAESSDGITTKLVYRTSLFRHETSDRLLARLDHVLIQALSSPDLQIRNISVIPQAEYEQQVSSWNRTEQAAYSRECFPQLFDALACASPGSIAVQCGDLALSYGDARMASDSFASELLAIGVEKGMRVAVSMPRDAMIVVAILAIWRIGAVYVPIDSEYPYERISWMVSDSNAKALITLPEITHRFAELAIPVVALGQQYRLSREGRSGTLVSPLPVQPSDLAYLIYTSGSTGVPKGVMVEHGSLINTLSYLADFYGYTQADTMAALSSFCFDVSLAELLAPLIGGASSLILKREEIVDVEMMADRLNEVTVFVAVPSLITEFLDSLLLNARPPAFERLRWASATGELVSSTVVDKLHRAFPTARLGALYGPTETTIYSAAIEIRQDQALRHPIVGRPLANTKCLILDESLRPVPIGAVGELYIAGACIARGYNHQPSLTASRYVPCPFAGARGARMYRTGDLARYSADGVIEYLGRMDDQIKVRGFRIEPAEIDAVLTSHPSVNAAVTIPIRNGGQLTGLASYVILSVNVAPLTLLTWLRTKLPAYMIPGAIIPIENFPTTSNGKLNKAALPPPTVTSDEGPAESPLEEELVNIWKEVLDLDRVNVTDSFFDLGGHSLLLTRLRQVIRSRLQREVSLLDIFTYPTIRSLARHINASSQPQGLVSTENGSLSDKPRERLARMGQALRDRGRTQNLG